MKPAKRAPIETGTQNKTGVDYDWLPPGTVSTPSEYMTSDVHVCNCNKHFHHIFCCVSVEKSPSHKSPRNRKNKDKTESSS